MSSTIKNLVFRNGYPIFDTRYNACVGNNGRVDGDVYASGFATSVEILIDTALDDSKDISVDEIVYPICFGIRHCVEIYIKELLSILESITSFKTKGLAIDYEKLKKERKLHNLESLWNEFVEKSESFDERFKSFNKLITKYVLDISSIDPTGETFRYATDRKNQKHLVKVSLISIEHLKYIFRYIKNIFHRIISFSNQISLEYSQGSNTKKLSRNEVYSISKNLPIKKKWGTAAFKRKRKSIIKKYKISNREFTESLKIIENNYEFSYEVGITLPLRGILEDDLFCFMEYWCKYHKASNNEEDIILGSSSTYESLISKQCSDKYISEYWSMVENKITPEKISGLIAIYEFGKINNNYSEEYSEIYEHELKCNSNLYKDELYDLLMHNLMKTNFINASLKTLSVLKYKVLAKKVRLIRKKYC